MKWHHDVLCILHASCHWKHWSKFYQSTEDKLTRLKLNVPWTLNSIVCACVLRTIKSGKTRTKKTRNTLGNRNDNCRSQWIWKLVVQIYCSIWWCLLVTTHNTAPPHTIVCHFLLFLSNCVCAASIFHPISWCSLCYPIWYCCVTDVPHQIYSECGWKVYIINAFDTIKCTPRVTNEKHLVS